MARSGIRESSEGDVSRFTPEPYAGYNTGMALQTFRQLLEQRPFRAFRLVMLSGQAYEVRYAEMAMLTRTDMLVGTDVAGDGVPAEFKICSLLHVATVEPLGS